MFRKFVCVFLIVWLSAAPAYAATSSSALDWQVAPMSLDDGIMVASESSGVVVSAIAGLYDLSSDSIFLEAPTVSSTVGADGSLSFYGAPLNVSDYDFSSSNLKVSSRFELSNLNWSSGRSYRVIANNYYLYFYSLGSDSFESFFTDNAYPFLAFVDCYWSGTMKSVNSNTFVSFRNKRVRVPLSAIITKYVERPYGFTGNIDFTINADAPFTTIVEDGYEYEFVSGTITKIDLWQIYDIDSSNFYSLTDEMLSSPNLEVSTGFSPYLSPVYLNIIYSSSGFGSTTDSLVSSGIKSISSSISSLSNNMNAKFNEVKQTVQQGASEVKNEISNQTKTLTDKLTDVKDGIVNGITELKETTEQGFKDVVQGITDLPGKMQEMLTEFIVPDEETVAGKMTDFQSLAEDKLGVIYQVPTMLFDMAEGIVSGVTNPQGEMVLPKFEIIMPATNQTRAVETLTVWEEYRFPIWPAGTEVIQTAVQTATSMLCVILTFNSLKRKYEEWLDGH